MNKTKRAVLISAIGENSLQLVNFIAVAVLARLLSPEEIGLFAVAMAIAFVAAEIRSFGVGEFLIREKNISRETIRSVLGVMILMSWGVGILILMMSPYISNFFAADDLATILCIVTIPFFFAPHSAVPVALISREMNFDAVFKIHLIGCLGGNAVKIGLVYLGYSYYGLAWGTLFGVILEFLAITWCRPKETPWLPSFTGISSILKVGSKIGVAKFLATFSQNSVDLVLGKTLNMHSVGMFSRGIGLILFIQNILIKAVTPVALPHFSEISRENKGDLKQAYLNSVVLVGAITMPFFAVVSLSATDLITTLFGDQWHDAGKIASILTLWAIINSVHCFSSALFVATTKESHLLIKEVISLAVKLAFLLFAIPYGLQAVAWSFVFAGLVEFFIISLFLRKLINLRINETFRQFLPNIMISLTCWLVLFFMYENGLFENFNSVMTLTGIGFVMIPLWIAGIFLTGHPIKSHLTPALLLSR